MILPTLTFSTTVLWPFSPTTWLPASTAPASYSLSLGSRQKKGFQLDQQNLRCSHTFPFAPPFHLSFHLSFKDEENTVSALCPRRSDSQWERHWPYTNHYNILLSHYGKSVDRFCIIWECLVNASSALPFPFLRFEWSHAGCSAWSRKSCQGAAHDMGISLGHSGPRKGEKGQYKGKGGKMGKWT